MRPSLLPVVCCLLIAAGPATAQDEPHALVERAIRAQGGEERLLRSRAGQTRTKGTLYLKGEVSFSKDVLYQLPNQIKDALSVEVEGRTFRIVTVFNGTRGWINRDGRTEAVNDEALLAELQESAYLVAVCRLLPLRDPSFRLTVVGAAEVEGRPAVGVKVALPEHRDVALYFDRETGLLVKTQRKAPHPVTRKDAVEERFLGEYKVLDGLRLPTKLRVVLDGKTVMEAEVSGVRFLDRLDPAEFNRP